MRKSSLSPFFRRVVVALLFFIGLNLLNGFPTQGMTDDEFLDMVEEKAFWFFWDEANSTNGLIQDRAKNFTSHAYDRASIASVGFGLSAICVAHSRGWISYNQAYDRILATLRTFRYGLVENEHGFFYHWLNINTRERYGTCEVSSIDTALFLAGALFAGQYFKGTEIETIADELYRAADWIWMSDDGNSEFVNMSWKPENPPPGFGSSYWQSFNEGILLDVLAIGSPTHPKNTDCWVHMTRPQGSYEGYTLIYCTPYNPLFVHQYPHIWVDLRRKEYGATDYFENSESATLANRQFCINHHDGIRNNGDDNYTTYSSKCWVLTAGDGPDGGYHWQYGAEPRDIAGDDGTVQPTAAAGSIVFTPEESIEALKYMYDNYKTFIWGKYGFCDGFNLDRNPDWWASDVIGISQGVIMLAIENYRTGMVWDVFMQIPYVSDALNRMGFSDTGDNTRPEKIDLKVEKGSNTGEVILEWTAPGDDENVGKATEYIIRYSEKEINNCARWYDAIDVTGEAVPKDAGRKETFSIKNLTPGGKYYFAIRAVDDEGNKSILSNSPFTSPERKKSKVNQIYPNPFNPTKARNATISYNLSSAANVVIEVYNLTGERVEDWSEGYKSEGEHKTTWEGRNRAQKQVASGIYIVVLRENGIAVDRKKMAIIK